MPFIHVTAPEGALTQDAQAAFISSLSNAVLRSEGADPEDPAAQALVWAYYVEQPRSAVYVGGKNPEHAPLRIAVTTPEGALDDRGRGTLAKEIGDLVDDFVGVFEGKLNHWVMLNELDEGSWGGAGQIFKLADIQGAMNIHPALA